MELRHGALTYHLSEALLSAAPGMTYEALFETISRQVTDLFSDQHPQIEGRQDRVLFGEESITPMKYFLVDAVDGDELVLSGGAAHGLEVGSTWAVYAPGTNSQAQAEPLGELTLHRVNALDASGTLSDKSADIVAGCRCVLINAPGNFPSLQVDISALDGAAGNGVHAMIAEGIADSSLLELAASPDAADVSVQSTDAGWSIVAKDSLPLSPAHGLDNDEDVKRMLENCETRARARNVVALGNKDSELEIELNLFQSPDGREWASANSNATFEHGDYFALEVINKENRDLFVTLLDIDVTGQVAIFYPPGTRSSCELLEKNKTLRIFFKDKRRLGLPDDFYRDTARETFKAIVATSETNFAWLQQGATRSATGSSASRLQSLFEKASGSGTRTMLPPEEPGDDWAAINRSFDIHRSR